MARPSLMTMQPTELKSLAAIEAADELEKWEG